MDKINKKIKKNIEDHIDRMAFFDEFTHKGLNKFEISEVFEIADIDKDGYLSDTEWDNFYSLFV